jgi:uncharacterized protein (UPF0335 family)
LSRAAPSPRRNADPFRIGARQHLARHKIRSTTMAEGTIAADELRLLIERIERLEEEKKAIADDVKDVFGEAKSRGYDSKAIRKILQIRRKKKEEYQEEEAILETYMAALGMR